MRFQYVFNQASHVRGPSWTNTNGSRAIVTLWVHSTSLIFNQTLSLMKLCMPLPLARMILNSLNYSTKEQNLFSLMDGSCGMA